MKWICPTARHWTRCWQATQSVASPPGCAALEAVSGACHPNHRPLHHRHAGPLSALPFWALSPGLWPVDECYILAVSTGVSWGFACGGGVVSGPVCQLLVPLPLTPLHGQSAVAQHTHPPGRPSDSDFLHENERIALRIDIFMAMPVKRGCLKPLSALVLCFQTDR